MTKTILIISDDCRLHSGVANQSAEIIKGLYNKGYNVIQIGVSGHKIPSTKIDYKFPSGEQCTIYTSQSYDDLNLIFNIIRNDKPNCLFLFTDPHRYVQIWLNARTIRANCPIYYYSLWDTELLPHAHGKQHYLTPIYENCDTIACISKQSENFTRQIVNKITEQDRPNVTYIPHGQDKEIYKPLPKDEVIVARDRFFQGRQYDFVALFVGRNQLRKKPADLIYAWQRWVETMPEYLARKCALICHTELDSHFGTNLLEVCGALAPNTNIFIDSESRSAEQMNVLYNMADVTFSVSNAEGFGIPTLESLLAGTPIAASVTGGLQDQIGFFDDAGMPMKFDSSFGTNAEGRYRNHGIWSYPIYPAAREIIGSTVTPYLFNDVVSHEGIMEALQYWYDTSSEERERRGERGRDFAINSNMTSRQMTHSIEQDIASTINKFTKAELFQIYTTE